MGGTNFGGRMNEPLESLEQGGEPRASADGNGREDRALARSSLVAQAQPILLSITVLAGWLHRFFFRKLAVGRAQFGGPDPDTATP